MAHTVVRIEECSLFNSDHQWNEGYSRIICSCGWRSVPERKRLDLTRMHNDHVEQVERKEGFFATLTDAELLAEVSRRGLAVQASVG